MVVEQSGVPQFLMGFITSSPLKLALFDEQGQMMPGGCLVGTECLAGEPSQASPSLGVALMASGGSSKVQKWKETSLFPGNRKGEIFFFRGWFISCTVASPATLIIV